MSFSYRSLFILTCALNVLACAPEGDGTENWAEAVGSVSQAIDGGYLDEADTSVVGIVLLVNGGVGACSGTLIAPNVVLTAQHCVAALTTGEQVDCAVSKFGPLHAASSLYVSTKTVLSQNPGDYHGVKDVLVPVLSGPACGNDVAILVLASPIDASEAPTRVPRIDVPAAKAEIYDAIGYGLRGASGPSGTRYRRDNLKLRCVGSNCLSAQVAEAEWLGDTGICQGDSGGPATDAQSRVIGVVSRGGAGCSLPVYEHVAGYAEFIKSSVVKATTEAAVPTPDWATGFPTDRNFHFDVGAACVTTTDCPSNACLDGYCTRQCTADATCPLGYACGTLGYCERPKVPETGAGAAPTTEVTEVSACSLTRAQDPTKPIPWIVTLGALCWRLRRRPRRPA